MRRLVAVISYLVALTACAGAEPVASKDQMPPAGIAIPGAPVVALRAVDAPGFNVDDLTARVRDAFAHTSGVVVVDDVSVRLEIAACVEMPCPQTQQDRFRDATIIAGASISKIGAVQLGAIHVHQGVKELVRTNAQGKDAAAIATQLGYDAGAQLNAILRASLDAHSDTPDESEK